MNKFKRIALALLALASTLSLAAFASCGDEENPASSTPPTSESSGGDDTDNECTNAKGHSYGEDTGICEHCQKEAVIPALPDNQAFPEPTPCNATDENCTCNQGNGMKYHRLELKEGCYSVEVGASGEVWLSFSVESAGQYVLYSVNGSNSTKVTRYNANEGNVPNEGIKGIVKDENYYSFVNCGDVYFNAQWRATYRIQGKAGNVVKVCFVRVGEPKWEPTSVRTKVYASELGDSPAAEKESEELELVNVPYTASYFFDETIGYYRLGTKDAPGKIIYAAINAEASRLFESATFSTILQGSGTALNLQNGYTQEGDYNVLNYTPFIVNWADEDAAWGNRPGSETAEPEADPTKKCYENYCNSDGVYPVNKELHKFLNLFVKSNRPADTSIPYDDWKKLNAMQGAYEDWTEDSYVWLSACYYYGTVVRGTQANPLALELGTTKVKLPLADYLYCTLKGERQYTLSCTDPNVSVAIGNNVSLNAPFSVALQAPVTFTLSTVNGEAAEVEVTVSELEGSESKPMALTQMGEADISPLAIYGTNDTVFYQACYTYTAATAGTFKITLSAETTAYITTWALEADSEIVEEGLEYTANLVANDTYYIFVTWAETADDSTKPTVTATLSFTSAN